MTVKEYNRAVEEYADSVYRFIRGNLKDEDRSNDIVQDAYEKLWRHVSEIEYIVAKSWLFSTAYHNMIDIIRREKRMTAIWLQLSGHETLKKNSSGNQLAVSSDTNDNIKVVWFATTLFFFLSLSSCIFVNKTNP